MFAITHGSGRREPLSERDLGKSALGFVASTVGSDIAKHFLNHTR